ncbi:MAG: outer membrane lipoprotein chaperone LolA [Thermodesulfobacteriota bacterium]
MKKVAVTCFWLSVCLTAVWSWADPAPSTPASAADLLKQIQSTYASGSFSARFEQVSTLKAMDITDTAAGKAFFKDPGMMRWEYITPDPQQIITDGKKLWIYKPLENQVMTGDTPALFDDGQGVNFLAALNTISEKNQVTIDSNRTNEGFYALKLVPNKKTGDLAAIYFYVSRQSGLVEEIETMNTYEDTTRIIFSDIRLGEPLGNALFIFEPPANADVLLLDPKN